MTFERASLFLTVTMFACASITVSWPFDMGLPIWIMSWAPYLGLLLPFVLLLFTAHDPEAPHTYLLIVSAIGLAVITGRSMRVW